MDNQQYCETIEQALLESDGISIPVWKLVNKVWDHSTTVSFKDLLVRIVNDPASEASRDIRLSEHYAMVFYNIGVRPASDVYCQDIIAFRKLVKEKCGVIPHNASGSSYAPYAGKTNRDGKLRLNLIGMRHLLQSRDGNFGAAIRELCLRLEDQMRVHYDRHRVQYAGLVDRLNQEREEGINNFVAGRNALVSSTSRDD